MQDTIYIFLDVDGVLNGADYFKTKEYTNMKDEISYSNLSVLKAFTNMYPNHKIILSSSWREKDYLYDIVNEVLRESAELELSGKTPSLPYIEGSTRGNEILQWIKDHEVKKEQIIIFDDESNMGELKDRLIQTNFNCGLTFEDIKKAELLLK